MGGNGNLGSGILGGAVHDSWMLQQSLGEVGSLGWRSGALLGWGGVMHLGFGLTSSPFSLEFSP